VLFLAATVLLADLFYILKNSYKSLSNLTEIYFYLLAASSGHGFNFSNNQGKLLSFRTVSLIMFVFSVVFVSCKETGCANILSQ
jgi:hypothetical protein